MTVEPDTARTTTTENAPLYWDPFDTQIDVAPYDIWRRMRDEAPVYRNDRYDFWALSRYADVNAASRDPLTFSSAKGTVLELMGNEMRTAGLIIFIDPPRHDELRALISRAFTPRRIAALEERVRQVCREHLDPMVGAGRFDYLKDFGAQLPSKVISSLLGVSPADQPHVLHVIDTMFHLEPDVGMLNETALRAQIALREFAAEQLDDRRRHPRDDLMTALVEAELGREGTARRLTDDEALDFTLLLVSAGTETVARLLGWAAVVLADWPDERRALVDDPSLIPNAVEELLRFEAPSPVQGRTPTADVTLHGITIPSDSRVLLLTASAGRDERAYPNPDVFDVRRRFEQQLSFGVGAHYCLGAALARLEGQVALEETLQRFPEWEVDHDRAERLHTSTVRGYKSVPIVIP